MKTTKQKLHRAADIAMRMAVWNSVLAVPGIVPALFAIYTLWLIPVPIIAYWLLIGYWQRYAHQDEPRLWLWFVTIVFNLLPLIFIAPTFIERGWALLGVFFIWNVLMVLGATWALKLDWAAKREERCELRQRLKAEALTA